MHALRRASTLGEHHTLSHHSTISCHLDSQQCEKGWLKKVVSLVRAERSSPAVSVAESTQQLEYESDFEVDKEETVSRYPLKG